MTRLYFLALLASLLAATVVAGPGTASAWCRMTTSTRTPVGGECITEGVPLAWRHRCSAYRFFNYATEMTSADVQSAAALSFGAWHDITCPDGAVPGLEVHMGAEMSLCGDAEYVTGGPNVGSVIFVGDGDWLPRGYDGAAYAVTTVWHSTRTGEIYDVDMEINEARGPYTVCPDSDCPDTMHVDLRNVMTHEAGHWFGMAHSDQGDATMYFAAPPGEIIKRSLEADDIAGFCDAYGHADLGSSCDDTPRGGLSLLCGCPPGVMPPCMAASTGCCEVGEAESTSADVTATSLLSACVLGFVAWRRRRGGGP